MTVLWLNDFLMFSYRFAIYIPLFLPIGIPIVLSVLQAIKWMTRRQKEKKEWKMQRWSYSRQMASGIVLILTAIVLPSADRRLISITCNGQVCETGLRFLAGRGWSENVSHSGVVIWQFGRRLSAGLTLTAELGFIALVLVGLSLPVGFPTCICGIVLGLYLLVDFQHLFARLALPFKLPVKCSVELPEQSSKQTLDCPCKWNCKQDF